MKILAIWITKGLFIFVICIAEWNVCSNLTFRYSFDVNEDYISKDDKGGTHCFYIKMGLLVGISAVLQVKNDIPSNTILIKNIPVPSNNNVIVLGTNASTLENIQLTINNNGTISLLNSCKSGSSIRFFCTYLTLS